MQTTHSSTNWRRSIELTRYRGDQAKSTSYNEMEDQGEIFKVFHGSECDILPDGKLDYSEDVRESSTM